MTKGKTTNPIETSAWVKELPQGGGAWGQGITGTIDQCQANVDECDANLVQLEAQANKIREVRKAQVKLQRDTAKRAEKEASTLFANSQIQVAQKSALKKAGGEQLPPEGNAQATA